MKPGASPSTAKGWSIIKKGFSTVEAVLAAATFSLLVTALIGAYWYGQESTALAGHRARATLLAEEGLEAVRNIRDAAYANLTDGTFGLSTSGNQWSFSGTQDTSDIFTRQVAISTVDTKRKSVVSTVTWQQNAQRPGSVSLTTWLTNWMALGLGDWTIVSQIASLDIAGNQDAIKIQTAGNYTYVLRNGGTPDFLVIDVSSPASPSLVGSLTLAGAPNNLAVSGNYAYVANGDNAEELQIINIATPSSPSVIGTFNAAGNADANGVYVSGTTAYLVRSSSANDEFIVINISTPSSPTLIGSLDLGAAGNEVITAGNYAYIASSSNSQELQVVNIATPSSPSLAGSLNLAGNNDANTVSLSGSTVLLGEGNNLDTINVATPSSPILLGSLDVGSAVNDIALNTSNSGNWVYLATSSNSAEFQVLDITTLVTPVLLGSANIAGNTQLFGVAYSTDLDRAFGAGASNSEEYTVFAPS